MAEVEITYSILVDGVEVGFGTSGESSSLDTALDLIENSDLSPSVGMHPRRSRRYGGHSMTPETRLTPMAITEADRKALHTAGRKVAEWTQKRDQLIRAAVAAGGSLREVGAAVGMSHMAVKFIAHGRK